MLYALPRQILIIHARKELVHLIHQIYCLLDLLFVIQVKVLICNEFINLRYPVRILQLYVDLLVTKERSVFILVFTCDYCV